MWNQVVGWRVGVVAVRGALFATAMLGGQVVGVGAQVQPTFTPTLQLKVSEASEFGFTPRSRVSQLPSGGFVVAPLTERGRIAWFDRNGRFQRLTGQSGQGPGELGMIQDVVALSDGSILVADTRLSILKANTHLAGRQVNGRDGREFIAVAPNVILQNKLVMPGGKGSPFVVWNAALDSLRAIKDPFPDMAGDATFRRVVRRNEHSVIVSPVTAYEFAAVDLLTGQSAIIPIDAVRFPSKRLSLVDTRPPHVAKPYPRILALALFGVDTLVVLRAEAIKNWAPEAKQQPITKREGGPTPVQAMSKYMTFYFDVLDLRTGVTLGGGVLKQPIMDFAAPNVAYSLEEAADGDLYLQLYRVSVAGAPRSRRN